LIETSLFDAVEPQARSNIAEASNAATAVHLTKYR